MTTILRDAMPSDAENLAALSIQVWLHTYAKVGIRDVFARYVLTEFTAERFAGEINNKTKQIVVAEDLGHLVGYVQTRFNAHCPVRKIVQPEVEKLYVQEHFIGRGIGSTLLDRALDSCKSRNEQQAWLLVNQENVSARRFYERNLFQKIGVVEFELESERHANDVLVKTF